MGLSLSPVTANYFMEYFEEMALEAATHKPLCLFCYVDDTFVIWPHGPGKLAEFLDHLNGVQENIKFTMEMEREGHLPFLDIDIYHKPDGLLGHSLPLIHTHQPLTPCQLSPPPFQKTDCAFHVGTYGQSPV
jgi:hypothetical protein